MRQTHSTTATIGIFLVLLLGRAAPAQEEPPPSAREEISAFFDTMGNALRDADGDAIAAHFDLARMWSIAKETEAFANLTPEQEFVGKAGLKVWITMRLAGAPLVEWASLDIIEIEMGAGGRQAVVSVRTRDTDGSARKSRWWLVRRGGTWRAYDAQDEALGTSLTDTLIAELAVAKRPEEDRFARARRAGYAVYESGNALTKGIAQAFSDEKKGLARAMRAINDAGMALFRGDNERARAILEGVAHVQLSGLDEGGRQILLATVMIRLGEPGPALQSLAVAEREMPGLPAIRLLRASAYALDGRHEQVIEEAGRFVAQAGENATARLLQGNAFAALGRGPEAIDAYRKGLIDDPDSTDLISALGAVLPAEELSELAGLFREMRNPAEGFETIVIALRSGEHRAAAAVLVEALREIAPGDPNADYYGADLLSAEGKHAEAAAMLLRAIPRVDPADEDERTAYLTAYVDAMVAAGKPIEAYEAVAALGHEGDLAIAFENIGDALVAESETAPLLLLVAAHKKRNPEDRLLDYYRGQAEELLDRRAAAEATYARGMAAAKDDGTREVYRAARVWNLYSMDRHLDAYRSVPPARATFRQLAEYLSSDDESAALRELVAAHAEADGKDPLLPLYLAEIHWQDGEFADMVALLEAGRAAVLGTEDGELIWRFEDRLIRGLLRLEKYDDALAAARASTLRDGDPWYEAIVYAAEGDADATGRALASLVMLGYDAEDFYSDDDLGPALRSEKLASLRERYPPPE